MLRDASLSCVYREVEMWHADGTTVLGASRDFLLTGVLVQAVLGFLWVTVAGHLSDRIGCKRMYIIGCVFMAAFGFIHFALLDTKVPGLIFLAVALSGLPVMTLYGPEAALIAESFSLLVMVCILAKGSGDCDITRIP